MNDFSHIDKNGRARMVDVSSKPMQRRRAVACGRIFVSAETLSMIRENSIKKGDVLTVAQIAGIAAAKQTAGLIPLCHRLGLDDIDVRLTFIENGVEAVATAVCTAKTGVEMEALTAVSIALLAVYDMCKSVDKNMTIGNIRLIEKVKKDV